MRRCRRVAWLAALLPFLSAIGVTAELPIPEGLPPPLIPATNAWTPERADLGRRLFSDTRLSVTGVYSCASCHIPERAFTDGLSRAVGATGAEHPSNTPTLLNAAYNSSFGWTDKGITTLEAQHAVPLTSTNPLEMGFGPEQLQALNADEALRQEVEGAFGSPEITLETVTQALASYTRTLLGADRPFDRYLLWDEQDALSDSAVAGMQLFFSKRLGCSTCHASFNLSGPVSHGGPQAVRAEPVFHVTGVSDSQAAFRAPSLKYVQLTAPYMHDGSMPSLADVVAFYEAGTAPALTPFELTPMERDALIEFLESL